ncbi:MAG: M48 family metallopeptidase [Endomicrobium sp.]|jgi:STE24 endopeptidase|nr:M48 family metallopeptidase [Endomicrobium sp.]
MNVSLFFVIFSVVVVYAFESIADLLDIKNVSMRIPEEFHGYFDIEKYVRSQKYLRVNTKFFLIYSTLFLIAEIIFIISGGFGYINTIAISFGFGYIVTGIVFIGILFFISEIFKIPFSVYRIFVIEEKFGFNKMSVKTFITDLLKSWIITSIIGGIIFSVVLYFFVNYKNAWLYAFIATTVFELFVIFISPVVIMPLFNKYIPLEDGELKNSIEKYAKKENFKINGIFKMDASKRSVKSNAFLTGFGKFRRIVLFDTLIHMHSVDELTSILAHEMGHFRLGHIIKNVIFSFISIAVMFLIFSLFIHQKWIYAIFFMQTQPIYMGMVLCMFLYTPISFVFSVISNYFSRKYEHQADIYAVVTHKEPEAVISALKKLSVNNLSNLYPHKFKVFLKYSHPPVLKRIGVIREYVSRELDAN